MVTKGKRLVVILDDMIARTLPTIIEELDFLLEGCQKEIESCGPQFLSSKARRIYFTEVCESFVELLKASANGSYSSNDFFTSVEDNRLRSLLKKEEDVFKESIACLHLDCKEAEPVAAVNEFVHAQINTEEWDTVKVTKVSHNNITVDYNQKQHTIQNGKWKNLQPLDLSALKQVIVDNRGDQLAIFPSYQIFKSVVSDIVLKWSTPVMVLFEAQCILLEMITDRAITHQSPLSRPLRKMLRKSLYKSLSTSKAACLTKLNESLDQEKRPFTLDSSLYVTLTNLRSKALKSTLQSLSLNGSIAITSLFAIMDAYGITNGNSLDQEAYEMQLALKSYIDIALKRVTDTIPMLLHQYLVIPFINNVKVDLIVDDAVLDELFKEDGDVLERRSKINEKIDSLTRSKEVLLGMS